MDKSTKNILAIGGLGLVAWYLLSKNKSSETPAKTTTGSGSDVATVQGGKISTEAEKVLEELKKRNSGVASPRRPPMITDKLSENEIKRIKNEIQNNFVGFTYAT